MASRKYTQSLTGVAVRKAKTSLFDTASQRNDKPAKLLVLITAGEASDGTEADAAIDEVKADGINVFPVGIGDSFSDDTLRRWKTKGSFKVSFTEVKYGGHRIDALRQQICEGNLCCFCHLYVFHLIFMFMFVLLFSMSTQKFSNPCLNASITSLQ